MKLFMKQLKNRGVQVFISYRRDGGRDLARNIYERLSMSGYNTFFDYDSMRNGKFNTQIIEAINQTTDFILILSKGALDRCSNEGDWVRIEIEQALSQEKNIVLVASEDFEGFPLDLPPSISSIKNIDIVFLYNKSQHYNQSIIEMMKALKSRPANMSQKTKVFLYAIFVALLLAILGYWVGRNLSNEKGSIVNETEVKGYNATIHLMRYNKLKLEHGASLPEEYLNIFSYDDSVSESSDMFVYPVSSYISYASNSEVIACNYENIDSFIIPYHDPIIQLQLQSKTPNTIVLTNAILEIEDLRFDDQPAYFFNINGDSLQIINEGADLMKRGELKYCLLYPDESFVNYKHTKEIMLDKIITTFFLSNVLEDQQVQGVLTQPSGNNYRFRSSKKKSIFQLDHILKTIEMPNLQVYNISEKPKQEVPLKEFYRSLTKGETDEEVHFAIKCSQSCTFRVRLRMESSFGQQLFSNYLYVRYSKPHHGINIIKF